MANDERPHRNGRSRKSHKHSMESLAHIGANPSDDRIHMWLFNQRISSARILALGTSGDGVVR